MKTENEQIEKSLSNIETEIFVEEDTTGYQANKWFFTYHIKDGETFEQAFLHLEPLKKLCDKYIWGEEHGKGGKTPHLQGAFILEGKKKMRRMTLIKHFFKNHAWMAKLKNWGLAFGYCQKECNEIHTSEEVKEEVKIIKKEDFYRWQEQLMERIQQEPNDRDIYWVEGEQGKGKTQFMKYLCIEHGAIILNGKTSDMKNGVAKYKEKHNGNTPKLIVSNIGFDKDLTRLNYYGYEEIKDMCFYSGKYEGDMIIGNNPHLIIFANGKPETENKKFIHIKI